MEKSEQKPKWKRRRRVFHDLDLLDPESPAWDLEWDKVIERQPEVRRAMAARAAFAYRQRGFA